MRRALALMLASTVASACTTTQYRMRDKSTEIRLSGRRTGETAIRTVEEEFRHSYYVFGFFPSENPVDLAKKLKLKPGQGLVNAKIDNHFGALDALITFGLGVLTMSIAPPYGIIIAPAIWTTRTTTVKGDLVELIPDARGDGGEHRPSYDDKDEDEGDK